MADISEYNAHAWCANKWRNFRIFKNVNEYYNIDILVKSELTVLLSDAIQVLESRQEHVSETMCLCICRYDRMNDRFANAPVSV